MAGPKSAARPVRASKTAEPVEALFGGRTIAVRGAREHNLKNVDLAIPRDKLVVFTGLSGSGKSSLAFDTIYAEGQRRYVESLSAYARQFLEMMQKPDVDQIDGLSPAIAIEQKTTSKNPALDRRHGDRNPRLHAPALGAGRHSLFARHRPADREPDRQPDGRPRAGFAGADAPLSAGAGRARPEGRIPQGNRRLHEARLPAAEDRRPVLRDRRRAGARQEVQARHRGGRRPHRRAPGYGARASRRASRRRSISPTAWRWPNSPTRPRARASRGASCSRPNSPVPCSGFTIPEIEPRLFSFNNPFGACPVCGGLGSELTVDDFARRPQCEAHVAPGGDRALGQVEFALLSADARGARAALQVPARQAVERVAR